MSREGVHDSMSDGHDLFDNFALTKPFVPYDCNIITFLSGMTNKKFYSNPDTNNNNENNEQSNWDSWDPIAEDYQISYRQKRKTFRLHRPVIGQTEGYVRPLPARVGHIELCDRYVKRGKCNRQDCARPHLNREQRELCWKLYNETQSAKHLIPYTYAHLRSNLLDDEEKLLLVTITKPRANNNFNMVIMYDELDFRKFGKKDIEFFIKYVKANSSAFVKLRDIHGHFKAIFSNPLSNQIEKSEIEGDIQLSQIVACKVGPCGQFVRAMVVEMPKPEAGLHDHRLFLIDIGIELILPRELIYPIKFNYLDTPAMAVDVKLNIRSVSESNSWSTEAELYVDKWLAKADHHLCKILSTNQDHMIVDLINYKTDKSLTRELLAQGLGREL